MTAVFRERLRVGMHVLDVGANIGYYTMLSASIVKASGSVTAIEPNPDSTKLLEASRRANSFDNVVVHQVAAGREGGLLVLHGSYSDAMTTAAPDDAATLIRSTTVPCFSVDDLIPRDKRIDFVKIDVQGAEYNVLLGRTLHTAVLRFGAACHAARRTTSSPPSRTRIANRLANVSTLGG